MKDRTGSSLWGEDEGARGSEEAGARDFRRVPRWNGKRKRFAEENTGGMRDIIVPGKVRKVISAHPRGLSETDLTERGTMKRD
jgi:hypothetical protein